MGHPPRGKDVPPASRGGRRAPPPEATGFEARYLAGLHATGTPVRLHLRDGTSIEGVLRDHDRELLSVETSHGEVAVRKREIRYLEEC
jgi:hypothetical protein